MDSPKQRITLIVCKLELVSDGRKTEEFWRLWQHVHVFFEGLDDADSQVHVGLLVELLGWLGQLRARSLRRWTAVVVLPLLLARRGYRSRSRLHPFLNIVCLRIGVAKGDVFQWGFLMAGTLHLADNLY